VIRFAAAVVIVLIATASPVSGQSAGTPFAELVVNMTADVHKSATTVSEIIGKVQSGTALPVNRNLGSWVEVPWPGAATGVAFVHVNTGRITPRPAATTANGARAAIAQIHAVAAAVTAANGMDGANLDRAMTPNRVAARPASSYVSLPHHRIGLGGLLNPSTLRLGGSARTWWSRSLGVQFSMSRPDIASVDGQLIPATQVAPSVLVALPGAVTDSLWVRPFIGSGPRFYSANLETGIGYEVLGGVESTIAAMPQFALSAEMGYRWARPSLGGFMPRQFAFSLSGHWYVR
jgi:hypothetical protein